MQASTTGAQNSGACQRYPMHRTLSPQRRRRMLAWLAALVSGVLLAAVLLAAAAVYIYRHPSILSGLLQAGFARKTGLTLVIGELDTSWHPGRLTARNIRIQPAGNQSDDSLSLEALHLDFSLSGPLGKGALTIDRLQLEGVSGRVRLPWGGLPQEKASKTPAIFNRMLLRTFRYFVFSTVRWGDIRASNGNLSLTTASQRVQLNRIEIHTLIGGVLRLTADLRAEWPSMQAGFSAESIRIDIANWRQSGREPMVLRCHLSEGEFERRGFPISKIDLTAQLEDDGTQNQIRITEADLNGTIHGRQSPSSAPIPWRLSANGNYAAQANRLALVIRRCEVSNVLAVSAKARIDLTDSKRIDLLLSGGRLRVDNLLTLLDDLHFKRPPLLAEGEAQFQGRVSMEIPPETRPRIRAQVTADWNELTVWLSVGRHRLKTRLQAILRADADLLNPDLYLQLDAKKLRYHSDDAALEDVTATLTTAGRYPEFGIRLGADLAAGRLRLGRRHLRLDNVTLAPAEGHIQLKPRSLDLPDFRIYSPAIGNLKLGLAADPSALALTLHGQDSRLLVHALQNTILPSGWRLDAQERLDVGLQLKAHQAGRIIARIDLDEAGFSNPDGSRVAENIQARIEIDSELEPRTSRLKTHIAVKVPGGEMLWNTHYLSFKAHPLKIESAGTLDTEASSVRIENLAVAVGRLLSLLVSGRLAVSNEKPMLDVSVRLPATELSPLFRHLVSEPYKFQYPAAAALEVDGTIAGALNIKKDPSGWSGLGRLHWHEGSLNQVSSDIALEGIDLSLPILFAGVARSDSAPPVRGSLLIRRFTLPFAAPQDLALRFDVYPGKLVIDEPTPLDLASGTAVFGPVQIDGLYSGRETGATSLYLQSVAIDPYLKDVWPQPTGGALRGALTEIRFDREHLASRGEVVVDVFGGALRLWDPRIEDIFSSAPILALDNCTVDLDLGRLTEDTAFGSIQGRLQGRINNLEIVNGQAQRFDLLLETVEREGVPRKINVKAIENIARLGGGQNPFAGLAGRALALFDEFRYQKIGVKASLANDVFRINGTIHADGREFLVKKGGIPGVDVVNLNPDNRISFKDMLKRLQRIGAQRGGAVIR